MRKTLMNVKVIGGRFIGKQFELEGKTMPLPVLIARGNWPARNAIDIDGYTGGDAPFYYGQIAGLGYIIAHKDLDLPSVELIEIAMMET